MYEWDAVLKKSGVFFLDGGVLDDPVGGAADGLIALHHRDVHTGLDLFEGLPLRNGMALATRFTNTGRLSAISPVR